MISRAVLAILISVVLLPRDASANFFWPPALYYYSLTFWWVVAAGLAAETVVLKFWLRLPFWRAVVVTSVANAVSAAIGFVATWPVIFYPRGVDLLIQYSAGPSLVLGIGALILALNIVIEYAVAVRLFGLPRTYTLKVAFILANILSFVLIILSIGIWFKWP